MFKIINIFSIFATIMCIFADIKPESIEDADGELHIFFGTVRNETEQIIYHEGYVVGYDYDKKLAAWVSYYLKRDWLYAAKDGERKFSPDPDLPQEYTAVDADYKRSGFDRGHLARQADLKGRSRQCFEEGTYFTNIAPQNRGFNSGIWNRLEDEIDNYVRNNGDCWIITGPVFYKKFPRTIGANKIPVPDAFYKIIADVSNDSIELSAYIIPNIATNVHFDEFIVSVDSIEAVTNLDFFPDIDDKYESIIEKQVNALPKR